MQGFDTTFLREIPFDPEKNIDADLINDMPGNMWNAFSYAAIFLAAVGAADWKKLRDLQAQRTLTTKASCHIMGLDNSFHT